MAYDRDQLEVIRAIRRIGRERGVPRRHVLAALTTGAVESNFRNLSGGDRDSAGWRQERASLYANPTNLRASINRFFDEAAQHDRGQSIGELAADIQRPAAQYRGRYGQHLDEARGLLGGGQPDSPAQPGTPPRIIPGGITTDSKAAMLAAVLDKRKGMSLLSRYQSAVSSGQYTTTTPTRVEPGQAPTTLGNDGSMPSQSGNRLGRIKHRANVIDSQAKPYLWGGGHQGQTRLRDAVPLDCSGAVSKLLGINPMVASQFKTWGKPGRGRDFTVWAADDHVLVEIGGQFWGTSKSNPGGGAGWIPRSAVSASYLSRFTPRHF